MATVAGSKANRNPLYRPVTRRWKGVSNEQSRNVERKRRRRDETYAMQRRRTIGERKPDESPSTLIPGTRYRDFVWYYNDSRWNLANYAKASTFPLSILLPRVALKNCRSPSRVKTNFSSFQRPTMCHFFRVFLQGRTKSVVFFVGRVKAGEKCRK